jgi:hypothetical protein
MYTQGLYITGLMRYRCFVGKKISQELHFLGLLSQILSQKNGFLSEIQNTGDLWFQVGILEFRTPWIQGL